MSNMTGYEMMKKSRQDALEQSILELELLTEANKQSVHYVSQESYKLGLKFAIRQIEGTEALFIKAHKELPYANPKEADREHRNQMNTLAMLKKCLVNRYEGKP